MIRIKSTLIVAVTALVVTGCGLKYHIPTEPNNQGPFNVGLHAKEQELLATEELEWGLALSGGGLRSSLYSIGAMKAMYDAGVFQDVSIISTVSGGGYAAYWLYTRDHFAQTNDGFGSTSLSAAAFPVSTCDLITTGNFFTNKKFLWTLLSPSSTLIEAYEQAIARTYGQADQKEPSLQLHDLAPSIAAGRSPYLVINTTLVNPEPHGWADGRFEFTPLLRGNEAYGYHLWAQDSFQFRQAIAISGAAFKSFLQQKVPNILPTLAQENITLSDGGHSENLGAIALIRRGVRNLIIIDAEHDPYYDFGSYSELKERLGRWGGDIEIPGIERYLRESRENTALRLDSAVYVGRATASTGLQQPTTVYYIKMSLPQSLDSTLFDKAASGRGALVHTNVFNVLEETEDGDGTWDCEYISGLNINLRDWFVHNVSAYSQFLNNPNYVPPATAVAGSFLYAQFPQYTTGDQSFYLDQSLAFIGLGYFSAEELRGKLTR